MIETIYIAPEINKRLDSLRRSDKKAAAAAIKAEEVIERIQSGNPPGQSGSITKHGEGRIKGVIKFDLGSGYRLIGVKQGHSYFILYAGAHDDCHRWIENNRDLDIDIVRSRCTAATVADLTGGEADQAQEPMDSVVEGLPDPSKDLTDRQLREVFCGLVQG